ncbi:MAG: ABC transporter permease, partial [Candidatus Acidiferrales bacterium]
MGTLIQDIRIALRMLAKNPGFSMVVVLTLALGIGANTAVFSIVNSFLFNPLPVRDAGRLIVVAYHDPQLSFAHQVSNPDFQDFQAHSDVTSDMTAFLVNFAGLSGDNRSERILVTYAKGNYFSSLGVQPALGRLFLPSEGEVPGADPIIVLGHSYWMRRFNGDPSVVGKSVNLNGRPVTVVGVVPKAFFGTFYIVESDAYVPLGMYAGSGGSPNILTDRKDRQLRALAHLKPGVSIERARVSLQLAADNLAREYPEDTGLKMDIIPEKLARPEAASASAWPLITAVFLGLVGLVLIFTCVNVTNLLLSRASIRAKEMAVRASLGAGRLRLFRQLLTESLLLSSLGAIGGAVIGVFLMSLIEKIRLPGIEGPLRMSQPFDWRMFLFVGMVAAASGLLAGVVPAFRATRIDLNDTLRESGRSLTGGATHNRLRNFLVVAQAAGSLVALIMAGLFLRSLQHAEKADLGFQPEHLMNLTIDVGDLGYDEQRGANFYRELGSRVRALPGVQSASFAYAVPLGYYSVPLNPVWNESQRGLPVSQVLAVSLNKVGPDYFSTMRIEIVRGRAIDERDQNMTPLVAVVNELFAQQLWPGQD